MLISVIDAHVRIGGPDEHRVDSAIALLDIIEITIDGVFMGDRIVEISILHHHLWLKKARLRPLERRQVIPRAVIPYANAAFITPVSNVGQPSIMLILSTRL